MSGCLAMYEVSFSAVESSTTITISSFMVHTACMCMVSMVTQSWTELVYMHKYDHSGNYLCVDYLIITGFKFGSMQ